MPKKTTHSQKFGTHDSRPSRIFAPEWSRLNMAAFVRADFKEVLPVKEGPELHLLFPQRSDLGGPEFIRAS